MPVVLVVAAIVILAAVVVVASGRGGELSRPVADSAAWGRELVTAADMAAFRPPAAFLGYSAQATDQALEQIARAVADRDAELAMLRRENAILRAREGEPGSASGPSAPGDFAGPGRAEFTSPAWQLGADPGAGPSGTSAGGVAPGEAVPGEAGPGEAVPGEAGSGEAGPGAVGPGAEPA